jgi:hypothetical protein
MKEQAYIFGQPAGKKAEFFRGKELRELPEKDAKFLAGIFEIGGGMSIRPERSKKIFPSDKPCYDSVRAKIYCNDNNEKVMTQLQEIYGGVTVKYASEKSWRWIAEGQIAVNLLRQIQQYAPFRSPQIEAYKRFSENIQLDEKLCIARVFTEYIHGPKLYPDPNVYNELVCDPDFLGGVFAGRGADYTYEEGDDLLRFWSQNISLVSAMGQQFGVEPQPLINDAIQRDSDVTVPVSFRLQMYGDAKASFLEKIAASRVNTY